MYLLSFRNENNFFKNSLQTGQKFTKTYSAAAVPLWQQRSKWSASLSVDGPSFYPRKNLSNHRGSVQLRKPRWRSKARESGGRKIRKYFIFSQTCGHLRGGAPWPCFTWLLWSEVPQVWKNLVFFGKKFEFSKKWRIETHAWAGSQEEGLWETSPVN